MHGELGILLVHSADPHLDPEGVSCANVGPEVWPACLPVSSIGSHADSVGVISSIMSPSGVNDPAAAPS